MTAAKLAIERLIALGRVILAAGLLFTALLLAPVDFPAYGLLRLALGVYVVYSLVVLIFLHRQPEMRWASRALLGDLLILLFVLLAAPSMPLGSLYFVLFLGAVAGVRRGWLLAAGISLVLSLLFLLAGMRTLAWQDAATWAAQLTRERWAVLGALIVGGGLIGYLAERERRYLEQRYDIESVSALLRLDASWDEVWRRWLAELCRRFHCQRALLAHRDAETSRVTLWQFDAAGPGGFRQEERPPRDAGMFLPDGNEVSFLAQVMNPQSVRWVVTRQGLSDQPALPPPVPERLLEEFGPRTILSVAIPTAGGTASRLWLLDGRGGFTLEQLDALQQLLQSLAPILDNLLAVRRWIAQATDDERDRIVRDLHDGVAQTLASLEMQLSVLARTKDPQTTDVPAELRRLQEIVGEEKERLRAYLRTLKSVHVPPPELANWILAHCSQWQQETGIEVEVVADTIGLALPEGVCREVFLILREALHNVQKHAGAKHVLVKLRQDESCLRLLVDDDGRGFPFAGTYSQHALEELGLGPVSICERARALGAVLTVDSTPGIGSTLRVDIPLS
jgi:signal transduction histidine kinase